MTLQCQEKGKTFRVLTSWQRSWQAAQSVIQVEMCKERLTNILQERHFILKVPSNYIKKHVGWKSEFPKCVSEKTVKILHRTPQWGWNCCVKLFVTFFNDWPSKTWPCFWWFFKRSWVYWSKMSSAECTSRPSVLLWAFCGQTALQWTGKWNQPTNQ